jgi:AraC-like DNA-binding protein
MLRYLGLGARSLGDVPMPPHKRMNWEFFAVVHGTCAPILVAKPAPPLTRDTLWLFPPGYVHGWIGKPGADCQVLVLHFSSVPFAVEQATEELGPISVRLHSAERKRLIRAAHALRSHYWHPVRTSDIHADSVLMELSLLVLRDLPNGPQGPRNPHLSRVLQAENWVRDHLEEKPSVARVASIVGISPSQLGRLFVRVRKESPKRMVEKLKIEKAMHMMSHTDAKLHNVAVECGYSSASNFCRAFRAFLGASPKVWRKETHIQYRKPRPSEMADYRRHGRAPEDYTQNPFVGNRRLPKPRR